MKRSFLSIGFLFLLVNTLTVSAQQEDVYTPASGWTTLTGNWQKAMTDHSPAVIIRNDMKSDTRWSSISADFQFSEDNDNKLCAGLVLNALDTNDFGLLRFLTVKDSTYMQAGRWQYNYFRLYFNVKLKQPLITGKSYKLSVAPTNSRQEWRAWTIKVTDSQNQQVVFEQGIENWMPLFGQGITGLYTNGAKVQVNNFSVATVPFSSMKGALKLAPLFMGGMVLQRDKIIPVWGLSHPSQKIAIAINGKRYNTIADMDGHWKLEIGPLKAMESTSMSVTAGEDRIVLQDIAIGEVWLASGQSNMQMKIWQTDVGRNLPATPDRSLRVFVQPYWPSEDSLFDSGGHWEQSGDSNMANWSAVAYSFAVELRKKLNVPVGIICSYWGGTAAESWVPRSELDRDPATLPILQGYEEAGKAIREKKTFTANPWFAPGQHHAPGALFNGMIMPHIPFGIRGVIWYQGESNANRAIQYQSLFPMLIRSWRDAWHDKELPFLFVQLPGYDGGQSGANIMNAWPALREAQRLALLKVDHTGMAIMLEKGQPTNIHPLFKQDVGLRLSRLALHDVYGFKEIVRSGPLFKSVRFDNGSAIVQFTETAEGLKLRSGNEPLSFVIAGKDEKFVPAHAAIEKDGKSIRVWANSVTYPVAVRYAWANDPIQANVINTAGLPASPFRTDNWILFNEENKRHLFAQSPKARPNIILFIADDIGWNDIGCYGNRQIKTPHIDKIARQGLRFNNFYLTTSSCSPSRCSIIAGRYPHNTGAAELHAPLPASITTFPQLLKASGYYTAQAGKWHLGESPRSGFDIIHDNTKENGDGGELLWLSTLQNRPKDKPFFCWFAPYDSHRPWGTNDFSGTNDPDKIIPPDYMANASATRQDMARYADEISRFDFYVGEVEKELKKQGVLENTIIIIMSDNGSPFPRAKTRVYDSGMKTFFIVRWDKGGLKKNTVSESLISAVDIAPTLLDLAGLQTVSSFQGRSFTAVLKRPSLSFRNYIFSEHNWHDYEAAERLVRTADYLYCLNLRPALSNPGPADVTSSPSFDDLKTLRDQNKLTAAQSDVFLQPRPVEELYDCRKDPLQLHNIAADPAYKEILIRLRKTMEQWRNETDDAVPDDLTKDWFDRENGAALPGKKIRGEMPGGSKALIINSGGPF